jgi:hypothetical protein
MGTDLRYGGHVVPRLREAQAHCLDQNRAPALFPHFIFPLSGNYKIQQAERWNFERQ